MIQKTIVKVVFTMIVAFSIFIPTASVVSTTEYSLNGTVANNDSVVITEEDISVISTYVTRTNDGFLELDTQAASLNGISNGVIVKVQSNIEEMNKAVKSGQAFIDLNKVLKYRAINFSTTINGDATVAASGDATYVESYWWGETRVYLSYSDTRKAVQHASRVGSGLAWSSFATTFLKNNTISAVLGAAGLLSNHQLGIMQQAVNRGRGVVIIINQYGGVSLMSR